MSRLTALIIDDESLARFTLKNKLADYSQIEIIGEASSMNEAIEKIGQLNPQLLFLDIQLQDGSGFDLLNQIEFSGKIVFVTAYDEYALRAFEINAVDYLLKPISDKRLKVAIERIFDNENSSSVISIPKLDYNDRLMVMYRNSVNFIKINTIITIKASREYCYINTSDGKEYLTGKNIGEWEDRLPSQNFCRVHRSTIINFDFITNIDHKITGIAYVSMFGMAEPLTISRNYFRKLKERYSI
jgi:two-component system, LytTR family, response regulator